ncbi:hypothetical protein O7627_14435 [Solwaraspora sp. WMMD1047]|nr:hypothetical protein [Solwaraspora sp. WMMD1047]MDG4830496.1 hypothetical protein [Solwaraspora sp. WMMD1047]
MADGFRNGWRRRHRRPRRLGLGRITVRDLDRLRQVARLDPPE